jgi:hypothetical protein
MAMKPDFAKFVSETDFILLSHWAVYDCMRQFKALAEAFDQTT